MTDLFYQVKLDNRDRVYQVTIHGEEGGRRVTIGKGNKRDIALGISALGAASAFFKFGTYNTPDSAVGIHISKELKNHTSLQYLIGYVHYDYTGDKYPLVEKSDFPLGWAPLVMRMGHVHIGSFDDHKHEVDAANKHDMIDAYILGYEVVIATLPYHHNVTHFLSIWTEMDLIKAEFESHQAIVYHLQNDRVVGGAIREAKLKASGHIRSESAIAESTQSLMIRVLNQRELIDLKELPSGMYNIVDHKGAPRSQVTLSWNPNKTFEHNKWAHLADANWQIVFE